MTEKTRVKLGAYFLLALLLLALPVTLLLSHLDTARHSVTAVATAEGVSVRNFGATQQAVAFFQQRDRVSAATALRQAQREMRRNGDTLLDEATIPYGAQLDFYRVDGTKPQVDAKYEGSAKVLDPRGAQGIAYAGEAEYVATKLKKDRDVWDTLRAQMKKGYLLAPLAWFDTPLAQSAGRAATMMRTQAVTTTEVKICVIATEFPSFSDYRPNGNGNTDPNDDNNAVNHCYRYSSTAPIQNYPGRTATPSNEGGMDNDNANVDSILDSVGGPFSTGVTWGVPTGMPNDTGWNSDFASRSRALYMNDVALRNGMQQLVYEQNGPGSLSNFLWQSSHGHIRVTGAAADGDVVGWVSSAHVLNRYQWRQQISPYVFPGTPIFRTEWQTACQAAKAVANNKACVIRATCSDRGLTILFDRNVDSMVLPTLQVYQSQDTNSVAANTQTGTMTIDFAAYGGYTLTYDPYDKRRWTVTNNAWKFTDAGDATKSIAYVPVDNGAWSISWPGGQYELPGGGNLAADIPYQQHVVPVSPPQPAPPTLYYLVRTGTFSYNQRRGCPSLPGTFRGGPFNIGGIDYNIDMRGTTIDDWNSTLDPTIDGTGAPIGMGDRLLGRINDSAPTSQGYVYSRPFNRLCTYSYYTHAYFPGEYFQVSHMRNEWNYDDDISGTTVPANGSYRVYQRPIPFDHEENDPGNAGYFATQFETNAGRHRSTQWESDCALILKDLSIGALQDATYQKYIYLYPSGQADERTASNGSEIIPHGGGNSAVMPESFGMKLAAHEIGHTLGATDVYDKDFYVNRASPAPTPQWHECDAINPYSIMGHGGGRFDAWHLIALNWITRTLVTQDTLGMNVPEVEGTVYDPVILKLPANPYYIKNGTAEGSWQEYFLVENRNLVGGNFFGDQSNRGMYIYHIDERNCAQFEAGGAGFQRDDTNLTVAMEQADGKFELEVNNDGASTAAQLTTDPFGDQTAANVTRFWQFPSFTGRPNDFGHATAGLSAAGSPTSYSHGNINGSKVIVPNTATDSFTRIINISAPGQVMTADVYVEPAEIIASNVDMPNTPPTDVRQGDDNVPFMVLRLENRGTAPNMSTKNVYLDTLRILESGTSTVPDNLSAVKLYLDVDNDGVLDLPGDTLLAQTTLDTDPNYPDHAVFNNLGFLVPLDDTPANYRQLIVAYDIADEAQTNPRITVGAEFTDVSKILPRVPGAVQDRTRLGEYNFGGSRFPIQTTNNTAIIHNRADRLVVTQPSPYADMSVTPNQTDVPMLRLHAQTNKDSNTRSEGFVRISQIKVDASDPNTTGFQAPSELLNATLYRDVNKDGTVDGGDVKLGDASFTVTGGLQQAVFINLDEQILAGAANAQDYIVAANMSAGATLGHSFKLNVKFSPDGNWASGNQPNSYVSVANPVSETIPANKDFVDYNSSGSGDTAWPYVSGLATVVAPNQPPDRPTAGFDPTGGNVVFDQNPRLQWTAATDPDPADIASTLSYRVDLATDGTFSNIVRTVNVTPAGQNFWDVPAPPLGAGTYYWRVKTRDSHGAYSVQWSDTQQFVVQLNSPPNRVTAGFNPNGIVATTLTPTLTWTRTTDPDPGDPQNLLYYEVEVDDNSDFSSPLPIGAGAATRWTGTANVNTFDVPAAAGLQWGIQYYWRVRALDDQNAASAWTNEAPGALSIWFRTVQDRAPFAPIAAFAPTGSVEISTANPVLSWNMPNPPDPDSPADNLTNIHYDVQVGTQADLTSPGSLVVNTATGNGEMTLTVNGTDLLDNTHYWWRVRALDDQSPTNLTSPWSAVQDFWVNIRNNAPSAPNAGFDPPQGAAVDTQTPTLSWDNSVDPDVDPTDGPFTNGAATPPEVGVSWIVQLSNDPTFATVQYTYNTGPLFAAGRPSVAVTTPLTPNVGNTSWYWKVITVDNDGAQSAPSGMYHFQVRTTGTPPTPPVGGFVPGNGTSVSTTNALRLEWGPGADAQDAVGALRYEVELASTNNFAASSTYLFSSGLTPAGRQYVDVPPVPALTLGSGYFWHVRTVDTANMRSLWSNTLSFTVVANNPPNAVTAGFWPAATLAISDTTPTLTWNAANPPDPDADDTAATMNYKVEVADNTNFTTPIFTATVPAGATPLTPTATVTTPLSVGVRYYWHVKPQDRKGLDALAWSAMQDFRIVANQAPSAPAGGFDPSDGEEVNSAKPRISWNAGADPNNDDTAPFLSYQLQVKENSSDFGTGPYAVDVMTPAGQNWFDVVTALNDNSHYYYRIRTFDDGSPALSSPWTNSPITHFYVNTVNNPPTAPTTGFDPLNNSVIPTTTPTLSWDNSTDPDPDPFDGNVTNGAIIGVHFQVELSRDNFATIAYTYVTGVGVSQYTTGALTAGTWKWRVWTIDNDGASSVAPSATQTFTIDTGAAPPNEPLSGFNPSGGRNVSDLTPTLSWDAATDPNPTDTPDTLRYELELSTDNTFTQPVAPGTYYWATTTAPGITEATVPNPNALTAGRVYFWRVRTVDAGNLRSVNWSATQSFVVGVNQPPTAPTTGFVPTGPPPTGLGISDKTPTMVWDPGADPDANDTASVLRYNVQVDDNNDFSSPVFTGTTAPGQTTITCLTTLLEGATYYWHVQTQDPGSLLSGWSATQIFHIIANGQPYAPIGAFSPPNDMGAPNPLNTANPVLSWNMPNPPDPDPNDTIDTIKYEIQLNDKADLSSGPYVFTATTAVNVMQAVCTTNLLDNKEYWWRVRAVDAQGQTSDWGPVLTFWINLVNQAPLPPDAGFNPSNNQQVNDSTPFMNWNPGTDPDPDDPASTLHYVVELSKDNFATAASYQYTTNDGVTDVTPTVALTDLTTWYWRVRTVDNSDAASGWSAVQFFRLDTLNQLPTLTVNDGMPPTVGAYHVQPLYGDLATYYELYVTYTDPENDQPVHVWCTFDNGVGPLEMRKVNSLDNTATDGILYVLGIQGTTLGLGAHGHFFTCEAGTRLPAVSGTLRGPVIGVPSTLRLTNGNYVDVTQYEEGAPVYVEVVDADQNANPLAPDQVAVTITSAGGDSETFNLTETGNATGRFRGSIPTLGRNGANNDGALNVIGGAAGMGITATYADPNDQIAPVNPNPDISTDTATVVDTKAPGGITALQLLLASGPHGRTVDLDWTAYNEAAQVDVAGYHVWASTGQITIPNNTVLLDTVPAGTRTYTATRLPSTTTLTPNTTYWFAVSAFDEGNRELSVVQSKSVITRDTSAPVLGGQNPSPGTTEVALNTTISFDLDDQGVGINQADVHVTLKHRGGANIPIGPLAFTGDRYVMQVSFAPLTPLPWNADVVVMIDAKDADGNQLLTVESPVPTWEFFTVTDTVLPTLDDQLPAPNAVNVPVSTNVAFSLHDTGSGIDPTQTVLTLVDTGTNTPVPLGAPVPTALADGVRMTYTPTASLEYNRTYRATASGKDFAGNQTAPAVWSFSTVVDAGQVTVDQFDPARGALNVPINTNISFRMSDPLAGIDKSTFQLTVTANGVDQPGVQTVIQVPDPSTHPNTMAVSFNPNTDFAYSTDVTVHIYAKDMVGNITDLTYGFRTIDAPTYNVSGIITDGATPTAHPIAGVTVTVNPGGLTAQTDGNGAYRVGGLLAGNYTVVPTRDQYVFTPPNAPVTLGPDDGIANFTGRLLTYSVTGTIRENGVGLPGVLVVCNGIQDTTDPNGVYQIDGLPNGQYTVTATRTNYHFQPPTKAVQVAGANATGVDFDAIADTFTVEGTITDNTGARVEGASVDCGGRPAVTDVAGHFLVAGLRAGNYTVTPTKPGLLMSPLSRNVTVPPSRTAVDFTAYIELTAQFPSGLNLVAVPGTPVDPNPMNVFGIVPTNGEWVARWNPASVPPRYLMGQNDPTAEPLQVKPGRGFFCNFTGVKQLRIPGTPTSAVGTTSSGLSEGWNMIGNPRAMPVRFSSFVPNIPDGIRNFAFVYDNALGTYLMVSADASLGAVRDSLLGWEGAWVRATSGGVSLLVSGTGTAEAKGTMKPKQADLKGGWMIPVVARAGNRADLSSVAAVVPGAGASYDVENPPTAPDTVDVYFTASDGARLAHDVRDATGAQTFSFVVACAVPDADVTVTLPDLSSVPADLQVTLVDKTTGKSLYARTMQGYTYHSAGAGSERTFELTVAPRTTGALSLTATAAQARGSNVVLTYAVTKACNVSVRVMNMAGRTIRDLVTDKPVTAGVQSELWNLCSATGTRVPAGMYLLQIEAVTESGQRVRGMAQVRVTR